MLHKDIVMCLPGASAVVSFICKHFSTTTMGVFVNTVTARRLCLHASLFGAKIKILQLGYILHDNQLHEDWR